MGLVHKLDLDDATFGDLYRFVDHARSAGIPEGQQLSVETVDEVDNHMDAHTLVADLGNIDRLTHPVLINPDDANNHAETLSNVLLQKDDQDDRAVLDQLLNTLIGLRNE